MKPRYCILDCYVDEPACFGVPPFLAPYARYTYGALVDGGAAPESIRYATIDTLRASGYRLHDRFDHVFMIGGAVVPGRYLGARIGTTDEMAAIARENPETPFALGGLAARFMDANAQRNLTVVAGDIELFAHGTARGEARRGLRTTDEIARWARTGADVVRQHPHFPDIICEIETYRGCPRQAHCSFCSESVHGAVSFRDGGDIVAEIERLIDAGASRFRLGRQADILLYGSPLRDFANGFPRPDPVPVIELFETLRTMRENGRIALLAVDNANPGTIANFPEESGRILSAIAAAITPGDTLALGVESLDPAVIARNNLKADAAALLEVVRLVNDICGHRVDGIPVLLPGINLIHGLIGETPETFRINFEGLCEIRDRGLLLRRTNIRTLLPFPGTPAAARRGAESTSVRNRYEHYRDRIRREIDHAMLQRVYSAGTVIRDARVEESRDGYSYARQIASYPITAKVPLALEPGAAVDLVVVGHQERSLVALPLPVRINALPATALSHLPGIGKRRASEIVLRRPFTRPEEAADLIADVPPALRARIGV